MNPTYQPHSRPLNILFIGLSVNQTKGGLERYSYINLKFLAKSGHQIYFYTLESTAQNMLEENNCYWLNAKIPRIKFLDKFIRPYRILHYLRKNKIDIDLIFCGHLHLAPIANILAKKLQKKYDLFVYGIDCWAGSFKKYAGAFSHLRFVGSISSFTSQELVAQNFPAERIVYIPPVLDIKEAHFLNVLPEPLEDQNNNKKPFILLTVGRLSSDEQYKGHDTVIKALPEILKSVPHAEYWIVGRGADQQRLEILVKERNLQNKVKFWGFVTDEVLNSIYEQSDVFIMPAKVSLNPQALAGEGFGIVFTEAALHAKPLIGPNIGGPTDIILDGVNGFQVDPEYDQNGPQELENELVRRVVQLAHNSQLRLELGRKARELVLEKFTLTQLPHYLAPLLTVPVSRKEENIISEKPQRYLHDSL